MKDKMNKDQIVDLVKKLISRHEREDLREEKKEELSILGPTGDILHKIHTNADWDFYCDIEAYTRSYFEKCFTSYDYIRQLRGVIRDLKEGRHRDFQNEK